VSEIGVREEMIERIVLEQPDPTLFSRSSTRPASRPHVPGTRAQQIPIP
jgi:hypothetical protein